ncbi:MAG: hypothetical protein FWD49_07160 [Firmicutes bacterium]|nr:hypothetical protein [Bacillota bacterium]
MKLVKSIKKHLIYELSEKELERAERDNLSYCRFQLYLKSNYEDIKPTYSYDLGYADWEAETLELALDFALSY